MATAIAYHREFTEEQSKSIHSVTGEGTNVVVVWKSNPDKAYTFTCSESYAVHLSDIFTNDQNVNRVSIGKTINEGRRTEELKSVDL